MIQTHNKENDPRFNDPRFQRRVVSSHRPIEFIENMHDVTLECGHAPLIIGVAEMKVGDMCFCPDCANAKSETVGDR